ncbi:tetratricopeptide repeat protein, partial [bacterium]|nr:tetratricopeptide repeat protein [bacterium]
FKRALQISPDLIGYYNLGIIYEKRGMVKEAIQMYRETLKIEPNFQIVENRLNVLCQREFIKQNTRDFEGYKKLGEYYFKNYDYPEAIGAYTECLEINDKLKLRDNDRKIVDISSVYYNLGKAYFSQGDYDKAAGEFRKALKMNPQVKYRVKHYMKLIDRLKN